MVVNHKSPQADQSIMGTGAGWELKLLLAVCVAAAAVAVACAGPLAGKAQARAELENYLKGPNLFYPARYDQPGPMNLSIQTVGWNATRLAGNVGIGNGSVRTFDQTSTFDVEYPLNEFMCGDVSTQPWIPGLKTQVPQVEAAAAENATGSTEGEGAPLEETNASRIDVNRFALQSALRNATAGGQNATYNRTGGGAFNQSVPGAFNATNVTNVTSATNKTAPISKEQATAAFENLTFAAFHPIQVASPVKDLLYEHPLSTSGCAYCVLLGFETPSGSLVNVGMKATGYGY